VSLGSWNEAYIVQSLTCNITFRQTGSFSLLQLPVVQKEAIKEESLLYAKYKCEESNQRPIQETRQNQVDYNSLHNRLTITL